MNNLVLRLEHDSDCESPLESDCQWSLYSFSRRMRNFIDPNKLDQRQLKKQLKNGSAFFLSYFEHGNCLWFLEEDPTPAGVEFQWDGVKRAGLLRWEHPLEDMGAKTKEQRMADARNFLRYYTAWCNGECYGYVLETEDGEHVDSCWGYIGADEVIRAAKEAAGDNPIVRVTGEASSLWE